MPVDPKPDFLGWWLVAAARHPWPAAGPEPIGQPEARYRALGVKSDRQLVLGGALLSISFYDTGRARKVDIARYFYPPGTTSGRYQSARRTLGWRGLSEEVLGANVLEVLGLTADELVAGKI